MTPSPTRARSVTAVARHLLLLAMALGLTAMHVMAARTGSEHGHGAAGAEVLLATGLVLMAAPIGLVLGSRRVRSPAGDLRHRAVARLTARVPSGRWRPDTARCVIRVEEAFPRRRPLGRRRAR